MLFRVTINDIKIFHGGDSAYVSVQTMASHLAFVPTGSPSPTCNPEYAFQMVSDVKPQIAVPMHGLDDEQIEFKQLMDAKMPDTKVIITKPYVSQKVSIR
jgi:L-ascorbate metabolism protein UlaG (beta-lactamase superfamily)